MPSEDTRIIREQPMMRIDRDITVPMRDGALLVANLYRPEGDGRHPVIVTCTPYGKDVHVREAFPAVWGTVEQRYPEILEASSGAHMIWECPDPEAWVARGYAMLQIDARGYGKSAGYMQPNSPQEAEDGFDAIEWAVAQDWCNGAAGVLGLGYITCTNWRIAAKRPKGLKAAVFCQGTHDFYRDRVRNDGVYSNGFNTLWWERHGLPNQNGNHDTPFTDMYTGAVANGPVALSPEDLTANRVDYLQNLLAHPLLDDWFGERIADLSQIEIPSLVIANWGGLGLQLRGTITGWTGLASEQKWLKVESGSYFFTFFTPERVGYLAKFFDFHLKDAENDWLDEPRVEVAIRSVDDKVTEVIKSADWPLPAVHWDRRYIDFSARSLVARTSDAVTTADYVPGEGDIVLMTEAFADDRILAGPLSARLWLSCETEDTDLFLTFRVIAPDGQDVSFFAATDPCAAPTQGWLRASQRKRDLRRSSDYQPLHSHDERQPLVPGEVYEVEVSLWPTSLQIPAGYRIALVIGGADFNWPAEAGKQAATVRMVHDDPCDRPSSIFGGKVTLQAGGQWPSYLALPAIPRP